MEVWKVVLRLWALLSFLSLAIAGACIWLDLHGRATTLLFDTYEVSHVTVFLFTASAPFFLAILMPILGVFLIFIRWCVGIDEPHAPPRKKPRAAAVTPASRDATHRENAA
jgi:H+/Cl- antiporter ClcA